MLKKLFLLALIYRVVYRFRFLSDIHAVGGCVRDAYLGKFPTDMDLATADLPNVVKVKCAVRGYEVIETGLKHGTLTIINPKTGNRYEITTFRSDHECDGRRAHVQFEDNIEEDLGRRDFTINAMAIGLKGVRHQYN